MDKPISVGDLVVIVDECCPNESSLGEIHRVLQIGTFHSGCDYCGDSSHGVLAHLTGGEDDNDHWVPLPWIKRIPPLEELEGAKTEEKLREPV